ncbi:hypothetical protein ACHAWF_005701 [Thalassiosira exigua]
MSNGGGGDDDDDDGGGDGRGDDDRRRRGDDRVATEAHEIPADPADSDVDGDGDDDVTSGTSTANRRGCGDPYPDPDREWSSGGGGGGGGGSGTRVRREADTEDGIEGGGGGGECEAEAEGGGDCRGGESGTRTPHPARRPAGADADAYHSNFANGPHGAPGFEHPQPQYEQQQPHQQQHQHQQHLHANMESQPHLFPPHPHPFEFDPSHQAHGYGPGPGPAAGLSPYSYHPPPQSVPPGHPSHQHQHHHPPAPPPLLPLPPPTLPPPPSSLIAAPPPPATTHLDAARQYYEARMREHALHYANAAAGAAWAAARIAIGDGGGPFGGGTGPGPGSGALATTTIPSHYAPAPAAPAATTEGAATATAGPRPKRTLWHPPSSHDKGEGGSKVPKKEGGSRAPPREGSPGSKPGTKGRGHDASSRPLPGPPDAAKRSKKRESGNDSVSSLGSESRDRCGGGGGKGGPGAKRGGKKGCQRRRYNEDADPATGRGGDANANANRSSATGKATARKIDDAFGSSNASVRQKRGLPHGHSSWSSFSSLGSGNQPPRHAGGRDKKKNRSQRAEAAAGPSAEARSPGVHLGGLVGKNGARALHELCSKYRWDMPKYASAETGADANGNGNGDISFVITVHVNGVELGRGRGGTKVSAKQDASRKALAALVPGLVFDPNGVVLDVGAELLLRASRKGGTATGGGGDAGPKPLSLDELGPHLASQLAIGGGERCARARPPSPDHSEDSSISTKDAAGLAAAGEVVSGGPLSQKLGLQLLSPSGRFVSSNIYPCASTTSGVSSASDVDDDDENAYYASRGASVCSTLLHAMWQIDNRIREPPSYSFDLCPCPVGVAVRAGSGGDAPMAATNACSKRKKVESPREVAVPRMFQCIGSLKLYFPKYLAEKQSSLSQDCWESPLEYLQSRICIPSAKEGVSRKRKDGFESQSATFSDRPQLSAGVDDPLKEHVEAKEEEEEFIHHKLEGIGTGSTKRESKHKASAKLLAALFTSCNSMVEVKAEAETARELYAAKKAASQTKRMGSIASPPEESGASKRSELKDTLPPEDDAVDCRNGNPSHSHLQSVKEEESEEVDDGSEGEDCDKKLDPGDNKT